jgi:hypothetical protein
MGGRVSGDKIGKKKRLFVNKKVTPKLTKEKIILNSNKKRKNFFL